MPSVTATSRSTGFYAPELDGLRWFAVVGVMIAHFSWTWKNYVDWGGAGVRLFFVLSGFLITHLLLRVRGDCDEGILTRPRALRDFLIRRIFRLWPLYFASLALAYGFQVNGAKSCFAWHAFFATNHYVFFRQEWPGLLSHYWTLAVEQQFYFIWPVAVLWLPFRTLRCILGVMLLVGPLARYLPMALGTHTARTAGVLLPACVDYFALGAAVAWAWSSGHLHNTGTRSHLRLMVVAYGGWLVFGAALRTLNREPFYMMVYDSSLQAFGSAATLIYLLRFPNSKLAALLRWRSFVFLGQISYGIYILHNFAHRFGPSVARRLSGQNYLATEAANFLLYVALTIVVAIVSYYCLEEPLRRVGQYLAPRAKPPVALATMVAVAAPHR